MQIMVACGHGNIFHISSESQSDRGEVFHPCTRRHGNSQTRFLLRLMQFLSPLKAIDGTGL
jgi:hypothetical protein